MHATSNSSAISRSLTLPHNYSSRRSPILLRRTTGPEPVTNGLFIPRSSGSVATYRCNDWAIRRHTSLFPASRRIGSHFRSTARSIHTLPTRIPVRCTFPSIRLPTAPSCSPQPAPLQHQQQQGRPRMSTLQLALFSPPASLPLPHMGLHPILRSLFKLRSSQRSQTWMKNAKANA